MINITNEDCMKLMSRYEDNHFDLAIVDPPYGIGLRFSKGKQIKNKTIIKKPMKPKKTKDLRKLRKSVT